MTGPENREAEQQVSQEPKSQEKKSFLKGLGEKFDKLKKQIGGSLSTEKIGKDGNPFSEKARQEANKRLEGLNPNASNAINDNRRALEEAKRASD